MTAYEWFWLAVVVSVGVADYVLYCVFGASATLTHLIRRVFAFDANGREKRLWRVRRAIGLVVLGVLLVHFAGESSGWTLL